MVIDWTLNVASLIQIVLMAGGALAFVLVMNGKISAITGDMIDIKEELKQLRTVLTTQVDHDGRLVRAERDIRDIRDEIKELRHGEGFVFPLGKSR